MTALRAIIEKQAASNARHAAKVAAEQERAERERQEKLREEAAAILAMPDNPLPGLLPGIQWEIVDCGRLAVGKADNTLTSGDPRTMIVLRPADPDELPIHVQLHYVPPPPLTARAIAYQPRTEPLWEVHVIHPGDSVQGNPNHALFDRRYRLLSDGVRMTPRLDLDSTHRAVLVEWLEKYDEVLATAAKYDEMRARAAAEPTADQFVSNTPPTSAD